MAVAVMVTTELAYAQLRILLLASQLSSSMCAPTLRDPEGIVPAVMIDSVPGCCVQSPARCRSARHTAPPPPARPRRRPSSPSRPPPTHRAAPCRVAAHHRDDGETLECRRLQAASSERLQRQSWCAVCWTCRISWPVYHIVQKQQGSHCHGEEHAITHAAHDDRTSCVPGWPRRPPQGRSCRSAEAG